MKKGGERTMMSKTEAAYAILKRTKRPMTAREIIDIAISEGMIETKGKTPDQTLNVDMYLENKRRDSQNKPKRFKRHENGYWGLTER